MFSGEASAGAESMGGHASASAASSLLMPHQHVLPQPIVQPGPAPSLLSQQQSIQSLQTGLASATDSTGWQATPPSVKRRAPTHACPVCGKHYVNEGSLRKHLAAHPETAHITSALRMWPCSICPAVFPHETGTFDFFL